MKNWTIALAVASALAVSACKDKPKELPPAVQAEVMQHMSEAEFAVNIRDYARAEGLLKKATELDPNNARAWIQLGIARRRQNNTSGAKKAYNEALDVLKATYKRDKKQPGPLMAQIEVYVLLGKTDDARKVLEQALKEHPSDRGIREFSEMKLLDQMAKDPQVKASAL
jgi:Flp pilus assembly protein TadD